MTSYPIEVDPEFTGTLFPYHANWAENVKTSYFRDTIVISSRNFVEQRRPASSKTRVVQEAKFMFERSTLGEFRNFAKIGKIKTVYVPAFAEQLELRMSPTGFAVVSVSEDLGHYRMVLRAEFIVIFANAGAIVKKISSIDAFGGNIDIEYVVSSSVELTARVFPIFEAVIEDAKYNAITDSVVETSLRFTEFWR